MNMLQRANSFVTRGWTQRQQERRFTQAIQAVYARWAVRQRPWANAFFDEYFLLQRAPRLFAQYRLGNLSNEDSLLANQWAEQFRFSAARKQQLVAELTPAVANFLYLLKVEVCDQERRDRNGGWTVWLGDWTKREQTLS